MHERGIRILDLVRELDVEYGLERSLKFLDKTLRGDRFLVSLRREWIGNKTNELLELCGRIRMPQDFQARFRENLSYAKEVHFGFEEDEGRSFFHAHLEYSPNWERETLNKPNTSNAVLLRVGFKWDPSDETKRAVIKHTWYPSFSVENILAELSNILPPDKCESPLQIAGRVVRLAADRVPPHDILYFELAEEGGPAVSFDVNLSAAGFRMAEIHPLLLDLCRCYSIAPEEFRPLFERIQNQRFGRLSGGMDQEGRDFLTVSYGGPTGHMSRSRPGPAGEDAPIRALPGGATAPERPLSVGVRKPDEKADLLFRLVGNLHGEAGFERSFKIAEGVLLHKRFLLGVSKEAVGKRAEERLIETCRGMGMPQALLELFKHQLPLGNYVHFGFEQDDKTTIYKVYLEFLNSIQEEMEKSGPCPDGALLHVGFKWDAANPDRQSLTRYTWFPWLSSQEILQRVFHILDPGVAQTPIQAAEQLMSVALRRIPHKDILYLEVAEQGNPRRSFDLNVYRANLQVAEIYPLLSMLCRSHSIAYDAFHSLYEVIKTMRFGHLAAGVDRKGKSFATVYYGVQSSFGEDRIEAAILDQSASVSAKNRPPSRRRRVVRIEETDDKGRHLYELVRGQGGTVALERSWKLRHGVLLAGRFLCGFRRTPLNAQRDNGIVDICRRIHMPEDHLEMFRAELDQADIVLFGFEKSEKGRVYKAYLEFTDRLKQAMKQEPAPESVVIHKGFKWDLSDNSRKLVAQYRAFHVLRAEDISTRLLREFYGNERTVPYCIVDDLLDLAGSRTRPGELLYFEVSEGNNPRRSFDVNMYLADLQMAELYPILLAMARHYSIEPEGFEEIYEAVKHCKFGHVSGGIDREGKDFLTVYFGEKGSSRRRVVPVSPSSSFSKKHALS